MVSSSHRTRRTQITVYGPLTHTWTHDHLSLLCVVVPPHHSTVLTYWRKMLNYVILFNTFILCTKIWEKTTHVNDLWQRNIHTTLVSSTFIFDHIRCRFHPSSNTVLNTLHHHITTIIYIQYICQHCNFFNFTHHGGGKVEVVKWWTDTTFITKVETYGP